MADDKRAPSSPVAATDPPTDKKTSYLPPTTDPLLGQTLAGRYSVVKKLGEGGMGSVYLATHNLLEKQIALKVLHGEFARKPDLVERFMGEAKAASRIRHENVIDISDFGTTPEGLVFFAMELLQGHDLHEEVARARLAGQLLPWSRSKKIFLQICSALTAAHGKGIIHRDLKPENVYLVEFLGDPDFVKLLDFGIAKMTEVAEGDRKLTRTGMLFGTPEYMSPEQARGEPNVDARVDIYAMGCILFQLVTGRVPFEAENFMGVLSLHLTEPPPQIPPEVFDRIGAPRELGGVISRALEKDRNARFQKIEDFANAVRTVCGDPLPSGSTAMPKQRAPSVPAPANTTSKVSVPATTPVPNSRVRTRWTGNLSVPQEDEAAPPPPKSKAPFIVGGAVIIAGAAIATVIALKKGGSDHPQPTPSPSASASPSPSVVTPPVDALIATVTPDAPDMPPPPAEVVVTLDSKPRGADIFKNLNEAPIGKTPLTFKLPGSNDKRTFTLRLKGYADHAVELVPNKPYKSTEKLDKIGGTSPSPSPSPTGSPSPTPMAVDAGAPATPVDAKNARCLPDPNDPDACLPQFERGSGSN